MCLNTRVQEQKVSLVILNTIQQNIDYQGDSFFETTPTTDHSPVAPSQQGTDQENITRWETQVL